MLSIHRCELLDNDTTSQQLYTAPCQLFIDMAPLIFIRLCIFTFINTAVSDCSTRPGIPLQQILLTVFPRGKESRYIMENKCYIAIDLKSFYASVECVERGLNPLDTCLVVADRSRTDKTICLAVSPALKQYGLGGRPRLFEVIQLVRSLNSKRGHSGYSYSAKELNARPDLAIEYLVATPRMQLYLDYSRQVVDIYLKYVAPEDIHVYSVDEVFIDITPYLKCTRMTAHQLALRMIRDVLTQTGITATAGIGSNLYLCKVAMDILAKKMAPDKDGVRIAEINIRDYRQKLWTHTPITDFWRVGAGTARKLEAHGLKTMGDIALYSTQNISWFYRQFGVNAELLIDHAWGWEPVTLAEIKAYRPISHSFSSSQVLPRPYTASEARNVALEMADSLALKLTAYNMLTPKITLTLGYDRTNLANRDTANLYTGVIHTDHYGRPVPYHSHGTINLNPPTMSAQEIYTATGQLFDKIIKPRLTIRRISISMNTMAYENRRFDNMHTPVQLKLSTDYDAQMQNISRQKTELLRELKRQQTILNLKNKFGKNAVLRGLNFTDGATQRERNAQIGGHKA